MKVLLLGGTLFLGKHVAREALKQKMELTLFNRGKTNPTFLQGEEAVTHIVGDRSTDDIKKLTDQWDVVIDLAGKNPNDVQRSVDQLKNRCNHYVYISSISAYKDLSRGPVSETAALHELDHDSYGSQKATCEVIVTDHFFEESLIIRPGLIVGPDDPTDRFTYWPWRMDQGGPIVVPDVPPSKSVQFIDVRDLAEWIVQSISLRVKGTFNATGPLNTLGLREFLMTCSKLGSTKNTELYWVNESILEENQIGPWIELPLWLPDSINMNGMMKVDSTKAVNKGLCYRPIEETILDTLEWRILNSKQKWVAGLDREREVCLLKIVKNNHSG